MTKLLFELKNNLPISEVGGKGFSLGILIKNNFDVPKGFVIPTKVFFEFLKKNNLTKRIEKLVTGIKENNFREKTKEVRNIILEGEMPQNFSSEIKYYLRKLNSRYISLRSSAANEDSLKTSFAGLHDTFLNLRTNPILVLENIKKCWASLFNERAIIYRLKQKILYLEGMAIIIQEMMPSEVSGITFTIHPLKKESLLIEASYGIGNLIVSGRIIPDSFVIDRKTLKIVEKVIGKKNRMSICISKGTKVIDVKKELIERQSISDKKIQKISKICLEVEKIFSYPQDIEWCIYNKIWLLQSRAITRN
jgi:pyruvate,water dikinase